MTEVRLQVDALSSTFTVPSDPWRCSLNRLGATVMLLLGAAQFAHGAEHVYVTSVGPDRYKVSIERKYLKTQYCYEQADHTAAIIDGLRIIFVNSGDVCNIEEIVRGH